jgi:hypothetical protein
MSPTLESVYSRKQFLALAEDLLPGVIRDTRIVSNVSSNFATIVSLGSSRSLDLQIVEVKVTGSLAKRVAIASDAFRLMKQTASYRSLVAFYSDETDQWRLSLLTAKPTLDGGKVVTKLSSPKRFSYLLGPKSKLTTPSKQLIAKGKVKDFDDLSNRFAVEVVNNEFYREISKLYEELVGTETVRACLRYPNVGDSSHEFAVRLIGRIIFCWFLREKRSSLDTPLIPSKILSREAADESNYYHSILAPLFFEVLNKPIIHREARFQRDHFASIPYLNGGLFSPDPDDYYKLDKTSRASTPDLVGVPDQWLRRFFDLLELYNFTVDENTSYDIDLSIDPEMLGRIFENLLARINPETGETVRKGTGSFYTPREIVEYMVEQSLRGYLAESTSLTEEKISSLVSYDLADDIAFPLNAEEKRDVIEALNSVRILDPACGSGAFPIGILQKIVFVLQQVDPESKQWLQKQLAGAGPELRHHLEQEFRNRNFDYLRKLGVIRESIYGVDIQPIATEISRLRCFLTLIVDQSVQDDALNRGIEPLPNLDFKFVTANSLVKLEADRSDKTKQIGLFEDVSGINELKKLRNEYFGSHNSERESLKLRFSQSQNQMLQRMITQSSHGYASLTKKVSTWNPFGHHATNWFDAEWMFGIADGFDIVIGNPPYYKENDDKRRFDLLRHLDCYQGKMDVWYLFGALGIDILKPKGILCFIATNNWTTNFGASKFRNKVLDESKVLQLVDFGSFFVFESSSIQTMVMLFQKVTERQYVFDYRRIKADKPVLQDMIDVLFHNSSARVTYLEPTINVARSRNALLTFSDSQGEELLANIYSRGQTHLTAKEVAQGIVFPQDYLNKKSSKKLSRVGKVGDGIFVLSQAEVDALQLSPNESELLKPYYTSRQIKRYAADPSNVEWVIYTDSRFNNPESMNNFPTLKKHLDSFIEVITSSNSPYGLHRARQERFFKGQKILALRKSVGAPSFSYVNFDCYVSATWFVIKPSKIDVLYLTGLLNSKLMAFWLKNRGKMQGGNFQIDKEPLLAMPIASANPEIETEIAVRVSEIYDHPEQTSALEPEIDQLVYELYGLTADDIKMIESPK